MLLAAITVPIWALLLIVSILTFIVMIVLTIAHFDNSGYIGDFITGPFYFALWLIGNLIMWLIFFIIV